MPASYNVLIDLSCQVRFPEACVVCGKPCHTTYPFKANPDGYFGCWRWMAGRTKRYDVPCHADCASSLSNCHRNRIMLIMAMATPAIIIGIYFDLSRWIVALLVVAFITPPILWQIHNPPPIEFMRDDDKMQFTFRSEGYAKEFASLNHSIVETL
jgi:hypothetical protein